MALSLRQIIFQSALRSKPVRDNFTDIENFVNNLEDQIASLTTPPAGTEVTDARDYHTILRDRLRSTESLYPRALITGGVVSPNGGANMKVEVTAGEAVIQGVALKWANQVSGTITAPSTNYRYDAVMLNTDNTISIETGSEDNCPVLVDPTDTQKCLASILLYPGMTAITASDIKEHRLEYAYNPIFNAGYDVPVGALITGGTVTERDTPDMSIQIAPGTAIVNGINIKWHHTVFLAVTAPVANTRCDYVLLNDDGTFSFLQGTAAATDPAFPALSGDSYIPIAMLVVKSTTTTMRDKYEIFHMQNSRRTHPNVYINSDKTLTQNKCFNHLIVEGCKYNTASYYALCQGNAWFIDIDNTGGGVGSQLSETNDVWATGSDVHLENLKGDVINAGGGGPYPGGPAVYKAPTGNDGFNFKIKAYNIYSIGTLYCGGSNGSNASNTTDVSSGGGNIGEDGGNGGNGGDVYLEAINEAYAEEIDAGGGNAGTGYSVSGGSKANLGGAGGVGGDAGDLLVYCKVDNVAGTFTSAAGSGAAGGTGSGGSLVNGNGTAGADGADPSVAVNTYASMTDGYYTGYADWMRYFDL